MNCAFLFLITIPALALGREEPGSPIDSVVGLIEEMQKKIEADGVAEQAVFDKYACWCEEVTSRKSQNIGFAMTEIRRLGTLVLNQKGTVGVKDYEINVLNKQIKENMDAQRQGTIIRQKENTEFQSKKQEFENTIGSLEKGIMILSGAGTHTASLIAQKGMMTQMTANIKKAVRALPADAEYTPEHMDMITKFLQDPSDFYDQKAEAKASYSPASTTIIGILKDMYDTFVKNLEHETTNESEGQMQFEDLMATKNKELATLNAELKTRSAEHAEALVQVADASQELDDTTQQMKADVDFFDNAKKQCSSKADAWAERVRARTEELAGISKAIEILTSDDAKALFGKAIKPGSEKTFLQISSESTTGRKGKAYGKLKKLALQTKSSRIAKLAAKVRSATEGHFDAVIKEVDVLLKQLKTEEHDDIVHRDWCKDETFKNEQEAARYEYKIGKTEAHEIRLQGELEELESLLTKTIDEIKNTHEEIKQMEDERIAEHEAFEQAKSDDEGAVKLLKQAIESLSSFYRNNPPAALLQEQEPKFGDEDTPPESESSDKNKSSGENKGIVAILEMLQEDLEAEISNGIKSESEAHGDFENALDKANGVLKSLLTKKGNLKQSIIETNQNIDEKQKDIEDLNGLLTDEKDYLAEIKPDCDWILEEFAGRREKRMQEMEGLVEAKAMLAGADPEGLIQTGAFLKKN